MSDSQQPEHMRPIPDGGLKEAMPSWLKRPPAWRGVPTAAERHERTLPEPDTSEIDPRTLLEVSDLPQWLQTIAARGDAPLPEPNESSSHAVAQVQAANSLASSSERDQALVAGTPVEISPRVDIAESPVELIDDSTPAINQSPEIPSSNVATLTEASPTSRSRWMMPVIALIVIALLVVFVVVF